MNIEKNDTVIYLYILYKMHNSLFLKVQIYLVHNLIYIIIYAFAIVKLKNALSGVSNVLFLFTYAYRRFVL